MSKAKKYYIPELAIKNKKLSEKISKVEGDLEYSQQMNRNIYKGNTYLKAKLDTVTGYFTQAIVVLEDVADRFDMLEGCDGFEWINSLQNDIESVLALEDRINKGDTSE